MELNNEIKIVLDAHPPTQEIVEQYLDDGTEILREETDTQDVFLQWWQHHHELEKKQESVLEKKMNESAQISENLVKAKLELQHLDKILEQLLEEKYLVFDFISKPDDDTRNENEESCAKFVRKKKVLKEAGEMLKKMSNQAKEEVEKDQIFLEKLKQVLTKWNVILRKPSRLFVDLSPLVTKDYPFIPEIIKTDKGDLLIQTEKKEQVILQVICKAYQQNQGGEGLTSLLDFLKLEIDNDHDWNYQLTRIQQNIFQEQLFRDLRKVFETFPVGNGYSYCEIATESISCQTESGYSIFFHLEQSDGLDITENNNQTHENLVADNESTLAGSIFKCILQDMYLQEKTRKKIDSNLFSVATEAGLFFSRDEMIKRNYSNQRKLPEKFIMKTNYMKFSKACLVLFEKIAAHTQGLVIHLLPPNDLNLTIDFEIYYFQRRKLLSIYIPKLKDRESIDIIQNWLLDFIAFCIAEDLERVANSFVYHLTVLEPRFDEKVLEQSDNNHLAFVENIRISHGHWRIVVERLKLNNSLTVDIKSDLKNSRVSISYNACYEFIKFGSWSRIPGKTHINKMEVLMVSLI